MQGVCVAMRAMKRRRVVEVSNLADLHMKCGLLSVIDSSWANAFQDGRVRGGAKAVAVSTARRMTAALVYSSGMTPSSSAGMETGMALAADSLVSTCTMDDTAGDGDDKTMDEKKTRDGTCAPILSRAATWHT